MFISPKTVSRGQHRVTNKRTKAAKVLAYVHSGPVKRGFLKKKKSMVSSVLINRR